MNFIDSDDLNGWQRLGIVISVLWAVGISLTAINSLPSVAWEKHHKLRLVPLDHAPGGKDPAWMSAPLVHPPGEQVQQDPKSWEPPKEAFEVSKTYDLEKVKRDFEIWAALVVIPILLGWTFTYAAIGALRWIAAGFRR